MTLNKTLPDGSEYKRGILPAVASILAICADTGSCFGRPQASTPNELQCVLSRNNAARAAIGLRELIAENEQLVKDLDAAREQLNGALGENAYLGRIRDGQSANIYNLLKERDDLQDANRRLNALLEQLQQSAANAAEDGDEEPTVVFQFAAEGFGTAAIDGLTPDEASDLLVRLYEAGVDVAGEEE